MKKILVTGASGFIGRHCLPMLIEKGYEVHAVDIKVEAEKKDVHWHKANLLDRGQVSKLTASVRPDMMLHFAWYAVPGKYWTSLENFKWVSASLDLLNEFYANGGKRAVMAGTCAEYSWKYEKCSEYITPLEPATLYGTCKKSLCTMLDAFSGQTALSSAWGRVFFLYGPHEYPDRLVPLVINSLLNGKPCALSSGRQVRDFLYVEDVASAFVDLLASDVEGAVNIGSGVPVSIRETVDLIAKKIGRPDLVKFGELPTLPNDPPVLTADARKLREDVHWSNRYSLDQGLDKTIQWWKSHLSKG